MGLMAEASVLADKEIAVEEVSIWGPAASQQVLLILNRRAGAYLSEPADVVEAYREHVLDRPAHLGDGDSGVDRLESGDVGFVFHRADRVLAQRPAAFHDLPVGVLEGGTRGAEVADHEFSGRGEIEHVVASSQIFQLLQGSFRIQNNLIDATRIGLGARASHGGTNP